jgi:hypothetical protein
LLTFCCLAEKPLKFLEVLNKCKVLIYTKTCAILLFPEKPSKARGLSAKDSCLLPLQGEQLRGGPGRS